MVGALHSNSIPSSAINICVGGYDGTVAGLTLAVDDSSALTLRLNFAYDAHISAVRSAALCGSTLVTGGTDETIRIYDLSRRVEIGTLMPHDGTINALHFANDAGRELLFSASDDHSISVCRVSDWECLKRLHGHNAPVLDLAVHSSAKLAISVAKDRSLFLWNLVRGRIAFSAKTKEKPATKVMWTPDGNKYLLASGNMVSLSHIEKRTVESFKHEAEVLCAEFMDINSFFTGGEEKVVRMWDSREPNNSSMMFAHGRRVKNLHLVENLLVSADAGGEIKVWDIRKQGKPRIETAIADGNFRLTCMSAASEMKPVVAELSKYEKVGEDIAQRGNRVQNSRDRKEKGKRIQNEENKAKSTNTASQRKRKKRKLQKASSDGPQESSRLEDEPKETNAVKKIHGLELEGENAMKKPQIEAGKKDEKSVRSNENGSQRKRKKRKLQA